MLPKKSVNYSDFAKLSDFGILHKNEITSICPLYNGMFITATEKTFELQIWSSKKEENFANGKIPAPFGYL